MARFETAQVTEAYGKRCEDRVAVFESGERTIIVVADGARGIGSGDIAAETVIREIKQDFGGISTADAWVEKLRQIDGRIGMGESTAVVVDLRADAIIGASVGDSRAWIICDGKLVDLTMNQVRKPLLGSGEARPVAFAHGLLNGTLIVATDGFSNYVNRDRLVSMIAVADLYEIPRRCVELVRLPSGDLWDDIGIVACRTQPPHRTRKRYAI